VISQFNSNNKVTLNFWHRNCANHNQHIILLRFHIKFDQQTLIATTLLLPFCNLTDCGIYIIVHNRKTVMNFIYIIQYFFLSFLQNRCYITHFFMHEVRARQEALSAKYFNRPNKSFISYNFCCIYKL
jgi:hypothetical protein